MNSQWSDDIVDNITRGLVFSFLSEVYKCVTYGMVTGNLR